MIQLTIEDAIRQREEGIQRSSERAENAAPGWSDVAIAFVAKFARAKHPDEEFTGEDSVDAYRADPGLVQPDNDKSWGGVLRRARKRGLIAITGRAGKRRKGHCSPCPTYRSLVFGKAWSGIVNGKK